MTGEIDRKLDKLKARRVQDHIRACLISIRRMNIHDGCVGRDATASPSIVSIEWSTLDLYTLAHDLAEEDDLRMLVAQARSMIQTELVTRSRSRECSPCRSSSPAATVPRRTS